MNIKYILYVLSILLVLLIFFTLYNIIKQIKVKKIVNYIVDKSESNTNERNIYYEELYEEHGSIEKVKFKRKIDIYLIRSGVKEKFKFINADIFILIATSISLIAALFTIVFIRNIIIAIAIGIITFLILQLGIYLLVNITYERIDNQIIVFLNLLENFAVTTDDIVSIFQQTSEYVNYPLNKYCQEFVTESRMTGNIRVAFSNLEDKFENERLKDIIRNFEISSRNDANYNEILNKSKEVIKGYFETKESKRAIKRSGQLDICISFIMGIVVIGVMQNLIPNLSYQLINTTTGNMILLYWMVVIIICFFSFVTLQKN